MNSTRNMESYRHRPRDPSSDWYNQAQTPTRRGRNLGQSYRVNFSAQDAFNNNFPQTQQPRRSRSADSRPQYSRSSNNNNNNRTTYFDSSSPSRTSYRGDNGFSSVRSQNDSNRSHSDVGVVDASMDSFRFTQIPKYEAVVHDDSMLYSNSERRRYRGNAQEDFLVMGNKSPARSPPMPGQAAYNKSSDGRIDFLDRRQSNATRSPIVNSHRRAQQSSSYEQERQYYNFAKENLITFGSCDEPSASTGLSQEELLQRRQREEAFYKRNDKRKTKTKNRILNFPASLRRSVSPQRRQYSSQQNQQTPPTTQNQSTTSTYHKMSTLDALRDENVFDDNDNDNAPNPSGYDSRGKGIRGSMVRRYKGKFKKSRNFTSHFWTDGGENNTANDREINKSTGVYEDSFQPENRSGTPKHAVYSADHDYLLVQRDLDSTPRSEATPRSKGSSSRPSYADFTPKSDYTPRDLFKHQPYTKESPTSVMDAFGTSGGVRWNKNLTQQEVITTPQSTKLRPDSRWRTSAGKPKSILRTRYSSSYAPKVQTEGIPVEIPFDEIGGRQPDGIRAHSLEENVSPDFNPDFVRAFFDDGGREFSPIGMNRQDDINAKFPESYVQFIEAVAAVVIQTKVRQRLAKKQVQEMRNQRYTNRNTYRKSEASMSPMVRKSYELARKVRQAKEMKAANGRNDVALDFYTLAAIQIQAAYRGWWVRDCIGVDNYCATMIQKTYRGHRCRNEFLGDLNQIVTVQSVCRRWMAIDDAVTRIYCIVRIQAIMRGALVRKRAMYDSMRIYHEAATKIQSLWRSFVCEMTFLRAYEDVLVVQSIVRGWIARRRFRSLLQTKTNKFSNRRKPSARFKSPRSASSRPRNTGTYSNHIGYKKTSFSPTRKSRQEISVPEPSVMKKANTPRPGNRDSHLPWKALNKVVNSSKGIKNTTKSGSNPESNSSKKPSGIFEENELPTPQVKSFTGNTSSNSRADIERRRKEKEEEFKAQREKENKRLESQSAGMAELELARKKMARKKAEREEEKIRQEEEEKATKPSQEGKEEQIYREEKKPNETDAGDSDYFAEVRKSLKKSNTVAATPKQRFLPDKPSKVERRIVDSKKNDVVQNAASGNSVGATGKEKSLVAKRREALMTANGDGPSPTGKTSSVSVTKADSNKRVLSSDPPQKASPSDTPKEVPPPKISQSVGVKAQEVPANVPTRTLDTKSAYQKAMKKLRSESEQKRIDYMHHIFDQAGLLSRKK